MSKKIHYILYVILAIFISGELKAQPGSVVIDEVVAIVGDQIVLQSDIERQLMEYTFPDSLSRASAACEVLHGLIFQKLLYTQALIDSIKVSDADIDAEINRRVEYFIEMLGTKEKVESMYGKTISELKDEMRAPMKELKLAQEMQSNVVGNINVSPSEVKKFFTSIPADSLPYFNTEVEVSQIVVFAKPTDAEDKKAKDKITDIRKRILNGTKFENMAILYSEDLSSATKGGDLGMRSKSDFVPEFAAAAMKLKKDSVSEVIKTSYGYHILKLVDRKGEQVHVKHILIRPKTTSEARFMAMKALNEIALKIKQDSITFEAAASKYSEDDKTKNNGGAITDPESGSSRIPVDKLDASLFYVIDTMKTGTMAGPVSVSMPDGREAYRIVLLKSKIAPHKANLQDDFPKIKEMAEAYKENDIMEKWMLKASTQIFIQIKEPYASCANLQKYISVTKENKPE